MRRHSLRAVGLLIALAAGTASTARAQSSRSVTASNRLLSVGHTALGNFEGDGVAVAAEWPVATLGSRLTLGVGGMVGLHHNAEPFGNVRLTSRIIPVFGVGNLSYQRHPDSRLALYTGLTSGVNLVTVRGFTRGLGVPDERGANFAVGGQVGVRYRLARRVGLMGQVGVGDIPGVFAGATLRW